MTEVSYRGECVEDGWVPSGGVATLSWRVLVELVLLLASYIISNLLVWLKITIGRTMASISSAEISHVASSSLMCPTRSGVVNKLESKFSVYLTYSDLP